MIKRSIVRHSSRCVAQRVTRTLNPLDFNPLAWYDAADTATITLNGSDVAGWADKSGNGYDLVQATASAQPAYANNTISFDGVGHYLWRAESLMYSETNTVTAFIVMESSAAVDARILAEGYSSYNQPYFVPIQTESSDSSKSKAFYRNNASVISGPITSNANFFESGITKVYSIEDDLSNITTTVNGANEFVAAYTRPATPITLDRFSVGSLLGVTVSSFADIDVKEILIFNTALSSSQKEQINNYLIAKHNIFDPLSLSPLAWYDASASSTITLNGSDVSGWDDKSGNGYDLVQATAADQPAYANNTISFDGVSEYLWRAESFMYSATNTTTIFIVAEPKTIDSSTEHLLMEGSSSSNSPVYGPLIRWASLSQSHVFIRDDADNNNFKIITSGNGYFEESTKKIYFVEDDLINITTRENNLNETVTAYTRYAPITLNQFSIGCLLRTSAADFAEIDVNEILIFNTALSSSQKEQITTYLLDKWLPVPMHFSPVLWLDGTDASTITESAGLISQWDDKSGNANHAVQATGSLQPTFDTGSTYSFVDFDNVDDFMTYDVGTYTGQIGIATKNGTYVANCSYSGSFNMPKYQPFDIVAIVIADTINESKFKQYAVGLGAVESFGGEASFFNAFRSRSDLTSFPLLDTSSVENMSYAWHTCSSLTSFPLIDTSSATTMYQAWRNCSSLTSFPLIDTSSTTTMRLAWLNCPSLTSFPLLDTSLVGDLAQAWNNCSSLTTFPANMFDSCPATDFTNAFNNTALTETSIDNILVSINTAGTSSGTFDQSGGSAPSATGEAAITAMRSRGWTVTVTGGF